MKYKFIQKKRSNSFYKIKTLIHLKKVGSLSAKKFFWLLTILNKKKKCINFNQLLYKKLRNIIFQKRDSNILPFSSRALFKHYFEKMRLVFNVFKKNRIPISQKVRRKRLFYRSFSRSVAFSVAFSGKKYEIFFRLKKIINIWFKRIISLRKKKGGKSFKVFKKHFLIFKSFLINLSFLKNVRLKLSKTKFKTFLVQKINKFLFLTTKKILFILLSYRRYFREKDNVHFVDFYKETIRIFFFLVQRNYNLKFLNSTVKLILKTKQKPSYISSDRTSIDLYNKLIGLIQKKGEKFKAKKLLDKALFLIRKKLKISNKEILLRFFNKLRISVEPKVIKVRRRLHDVPCPVSYKRKTFLMVKWLLTSISKDKKKKNSIVLKLKYHILRVISGSSSLPYKTKKYFTHKSIESRSNFHYRWW